MVIAENKNRAAFYSRGKNQDTDYGKCPDDVMKHLEETYGNREWNVQTFSDTASGTDSDRAEFNRLKAEILADKIDVVITEKISKISRDMGQFVEFMRLCNEKNVEVLCMDGTDAQRILEMPAI